MADELHLIGPNEAGRGAQKFQFTFDGRQWVETDFRMRVGHDSAGMPVVQKIAGAGREASRRLQQEVAIGRTLLRRIGKSEYPMCLSRLIGYNPGITDTSGTQAPYAVFTYQQGTLADLSGELPLRPELFGQVADGLIVALCYLQAAQIVHRHIRMETVRWDGEHLQLADFGHAVPEWEQRPGAFGAEPWDSPEQRSGAGTADCRDDVYAAALILARLATGQEFASDVEARQAIGRLDMTQLALLGRACAELRRDRPTAHELRRIRRLPDPLNPVLRGHRGRESEARARFAELRRRQEKARQSRAAAAARARARARPPGPGPAPGGAFSAPGGTGPAPGGAFSAPGGTGPASDGPRTTGRDRYRPSPLSQTGHSQDGIQKPSRAMVVGSAMAVLTLTVLLLVLRGVL